MAQPTLATPRLKGAAMLAPQATLSKLPVTAGIYSQAFPKTAGEESPGSKQHFF